MFPLYTKSFGGKIWRNLHSVSPDNDFGKKFKMASLEISHHKNFRHNLVQKLLKNNSSQSMLKSLANFLRMCCLSCTRLSQVDQFVTSSVILHEIKKYSICMRICCQIISGKPIPEISTVCKLKTTYQKNFTDQVLNDVVLLLSVQLCYQSYIHLSLYSPNQN